MSAPLEIETHPFPALLPPQATVMMMGTFPPKEDKRAMQFHYPNFQNDMWRVYGLVFFNDAAHFQRSSEKAFDEEKIKAFFARTGDCVLPDRVEGCAGTRQCVRQVFASGRNHRFGGGVGADARLPTYLHYRRQGDGSPARYSGRRYQNAENGRNRAVSVCRTGFDPNPPAVHFARLSLSLAKKAAAYRAFFEMAGLV